MRWGCPHGRRQRCVSLCGQHAARRARDPLQRGQCPLTARDGQRQELDPGGEHGMDLLRTPTDPVHRARRPPQAGTGRHARRAPSGVDDLCRTSPLLTDAPWRRRRSPREHAAQGYECRLLTSKTRFLLFSSYLLTMFARRKRLRTAETPTEFSILGRSRPGAVT